MYDEFNDNGRGMKGTYKGETAVKRRGEEKALDDDALDGQMYIRECV